MSLCSVVSLTTSSCSDDKDENDIIAPYAPGIELTTDITAEGYYKGDIFDAGTGNLWINFSSGLAYDEDEEDYVGPGYILCLDFNTAISENADRPVLAPGTYNASDDYSLHTLNVDGDSYLVKYPESGYPDFLDVEGGVVTVARDGAYYIIDAVLTLEDDTEYTFHYAGKLPIYNRSEEGEMSNLETNVALDGKLTKGMVFYFGDLFEAGSDYVTIVLSGNEYDLYQNFGNAQAVNLGLNVTAGSSSSIPSGNYVVESIEETECEPFTALSGYYEPTYSTFLGCWYFHTFGGEEAKLQSGTVTVDNQGGGKYKVTFTLKDGYNHTVSGSYQGNLDIEDYS